MYCLLNTSSFQYQRSLRLEFGVQFQRSVKKKFIFNLCWQWEYKVMVDKLSFCLEGFSKSKKLQLLSTHLVGRGIKIFVNLILVKAFSLLLFFKKSNAINLDSMWFDKRILPKKESAIQSWQHCLFWISYQYLNYKQQCTNIKILTSQAVK